VRSVQAGKVDTVKRRKGRDRGFGDRGIRGFVRMMELTVRYEIVKEKGL
jgi:hypothetical protein